MPRPTATHPTKRTDTKRPRRTYTDAMKADAVDRVRDVGLAAVAADLGIPRPTLSGWCKAAGLDLEGTARARTTAATAAAQAKAADARLSTLDALEEILALELRTWRHICAVEAAAGDAITEHGDPTEAVTIERDGDGTPVPVLANHTARALLAVARITTDVLHKRNAVVGAGVAIDKLALLRGEATERGEMIVRIGIPRPDPARSDSDAITLPAHPDETDR